MKRYAQIITASGFVFAVVRTAGTLVAPTGTTFIELAADAPDPCGMWWNGSAFQEEAP